MPAYVVAWIKVIDEPSMGRYAAEVEETVKAFGGHYLFAGAGGEALEGDWNPDQMAIIEFPSHADARRWYESPEYAPLIELRQESGYTAMVITPEAGGSS
jgi:uncharacterized protein (DUF1330 family)